MEESEFGVRRDEEQTVGLGHPARDLGEELGARDTDGDRQTDLGGDLTAQVATTLGVDLTVAGNYAPRPLPAPARVTTVDGFQVAYEGTPQVGATQPLLFRVTENGAPVAVQPYLGAYGHLVTLREGDLAYLHVHPEPDLVDGAIKFWLAAPSPGRYRMYLDFQVDGAVHTAEFTVTL